jgi:hypothetical protein
MRRRVHALHVGVLVTPLTLAAGCASAPPAGAPPADAPIGEAPIPEAPILDARVVDDGADLGAPGPGRYAATIEQRSGSCCSESCGAMSTVASITLDLAEGGRADGQWSRRGCTVLVSGEGPIEMPYDPGPPESVCQGAAEPGQRRNVYSLDGAGRLQGAWKQDGASSRVELRTDAPAAKPWVLRCARVALRSPPARIDGPLLACRFQDAQWEQWAGFAINERVYLDDEPGLLVRSHERGRMGAEELAFERR